MCIVNWNKVFKNASSCILEDSWNEMWEKLQQANEIQRIFLKIDWFGKMQIDE